MNFKTNKTKLIARVMLLVLLTTSALSFVGCGKVPDGYYYPHDFDYYLRQHMRPGADDILKFYAVSNTQIFDMSNITFNLLYGTHANEYIGGNHLDKYQYDDYPLHNYFGYGNIILGMYLCEGNQRNPSQIDTSKEEYIVEDIENVFNHRFIKRLDTEEAFSPEYGYVIKERIFGATNSYLSHIEEITIPQEYVSENNGSFIIKLVAFREVFSPKGYYPVFVEYIRFEYKKIDENTVQIDFVGEEDFDSSDDPPPVIEEYV